MNIKHKRYFLVGCSIFISLLMLIGTIVAIPFQPTPDSPYENVQWDLTKGEVYGWNISEYDNSGLIFNQSIYLKINDTAKVRFYGDWYYAVKVRSMIYNQTLDEFFINPSNPVLHNMSLVNFTNTKMYFSGSGGSPLTFFIPKTTQLMTSWVADASLFQYKGYFDSTPTPSISTTSNSIRYYNDSSEEYVELFYDTHGALVSGKIFSKAMVPEGRTQITTRLCPPYVPPPPPNIPFGNYFLVFIPVCIVGLIIYSKRKLS